MGVQKLPVCKLLDYIILTEHQLSAQFRPDEIIKSGWDFHAISGPETNLPQKAYRAQRHRGGVALLTRNSKRFSVKMTILSGGTHMISGENGATGISSQSSQSGGGGRTSPLLHQAVTWTLVSPLYNGKIHLTGVYIFPDEDQTQEFFEILAVNSNYPSDEPHIYAGDFNAYTAEEIEGHLTPQERHTLPTRTGDVNPAHSPEPKEPVNKIYFCTTLPQNSPPFLLIFPPCFCVSSTASPPLFPSVFNLFLKKNHTFFKKKEGWPLFIKGRTRGWPLFRTGSLVESKQGL